MDSDESNLAYQYICIYIKYVIQKVYIFFSLLASPTFSKGMENVEGLEGDTLQFSVEVNGNPKPTLKW